jgi:nucleoside-diphosphate-sugar epimerase
MKIIVTGALGHIGSLLIRELPNYFPKAEITMIDNLLTQRFVSLYNLPSKGNYKFLDLDIVNCDLNLILKNAHVVIHLAAITDAAGSFDKVQEVEQNNFFATKKIADACLENGVRLISLSSTSVYGTQNEVVDEDCSLQELKPQSPYAQTKLKEEEYILKLTAASGLKAVICRFGTIYGESIGMRFHTAVNKFCWQSAMNIPITVWKTAYDQKRPYLDINDAIRSFIFLIDKDLFNGKIYNVLTQNSTVRDIVDTIKYFKPNLEVCFVENKIMNQLSYEVSNNKFKELGFEFSGNLKKEIKKTLKLFDQISN